MVLLCFDWCGECLTKSMRLSWHGVSMIDNAFILQNQTVLSADRILINSTSWSMPKGFRWYFETVMLERFQGRHFTFFLKTRSFFDVWIDLISSFQVQFEIRKLILEQLCVYFYFVTKVCCKNNKLKVWKFENLTRVGDRHIINAHSTNSSSIDLCKSAFESLRAENSTVIFI